MDKDLKAFSLQWVRVAAVTLASVMFVAFTSIPYSLGSHPGEVAAATPQGERHMT
jgi:hypothetical protein